MLIFISRGVEYKLIDGKEIVSDGDCISTEASRNNWVDVEVE